MTDKQISEHLTDIYTWMCEPDTIEQPSLDWLRNWINRRPVAELGMAAMLIGHAPLSVPVNTSASAPSAREGTALCSNHDAEGDLPAVPATAFDTAAPAICTCGNDDTALHDLSCPAALP